MSQLEKTTRTKAYYIKKLNAFGSYLVKTNDRENAKVVASLIENLKVIKTKATFGPNKIKHKRQKINEIQEQMDAIKNIDDMRETIVIKNPETQQVTNLYSTLELDEKGVQDAAEIMKLAIEKAKLELEKEKKVTKEKTILKDKWITDK